MSEEIPDWMIEESNRMKSDNAQLQYALEYSENIVADLSYLVKQLVHSVKMYRPDNVLAERAIYYLKRKELCGSPLRNQAKGSTLRFRRKPVFVDAIRWDGTLSGVRSVEAALPTLRTHALASHVERNDVRSWSILTSDGGHEVSPGDWIIADVNGGYYPCKPYIFISAYEQVEVGSHD